MKKLSIFLLCLLMAAGCTQVDDTLKKVAVDDLEVTDVNIVVPSSGRTESTIVTTSYPWSVEGNDGWCKVVTRSGDAGTATILFDVEENETYEDRSMNFTIVSGGKRTVVEVWQKQKDAVLFDRQIFDNIKMEGDEIEIKVAANIDYNIKIDGPAQSWITKLSEATAPADNPFVGATVRFKIGQTEEWNEREGKIYFFKADDDRVYEMVRVFQVQHDKIVVDREQVMASMEGRQNVEVTLRSNVEYSAEVVNTTGDWLTWEPSSKANVYLLNIDPYPTPDTAPEGDLRTGYVEFADVNSNGYAKGTVEVRQINGELIYVVGSLDRELPIEGGVFDLIAEENIDDFELVIPNYAKSWISLAPDDGGTRAPMLHHVFKIKVEVNPEEMAQRTAEIYVRGRSALDPDVVMVSEKVTVRQDGRIVFANAVELLTQLQKDMNFRHNNWPIMPDSVINPNPTFQGFTPNPSTGVAVTSMNLPSGLVFEKSSKLPEYIGDLKDLTTITINANVKGELPKSIGALPNLTTMTINNVGRAANGGGGFSKIPREWGQLHKSLKTLSIEHNFTDSLNAGAITPGDVLDWVGDLESLETFTVKTTNYNCPMPESWENLKNLKSLTIDGTGFTNLDALAGMESLTTLNIVSLPISDLPDLSKLTQLQTVKIDKCANITSVPQSLLNVASLKSLTISSYKVARIDDVDWSALVNLETLSIAGTSSNLGTLTGNLSSSMNSMMKLKTLTLNYNNLSGNLVDIFAGKNLTSLNLSNNPGLTGEIPASLGGSALSTAFSIDNTGITKIQDGALAGTTRTSLSIKNTQLASFPMDITTNTRITSITLSGNQISTPIPAVLGNRMNLASIDFSNNQISGNLPDMSNWTTVTTLNLSNNQITGTLPSSLGSLEKITTLNLSNNQISGSIPAEIETMGSGLATTAMTTLDLSNNQLTGNLPSRFNRMFNIPATGVANGFRSIYLQNNQLSGSLPDFSHMILINLDLRNNNFTGAVPAGIVGGTGTTTTGTGAPIYSFEQKPVNGVLTPRDTYVLFLSGNNLSGPIPEALKTMIQAREAAGYTSPAQNWWDNIAPQQGGSLTRQ